MAYDELSGRWWESWRHPRGRNPDERYLAHDGGPLTLGGGKAGIIQGIRADHRGRAMLIGDGSSDLEAGTAVDLFVGFGGVVSRERVAALRRGRLFECQTCRRSCPCRSAAGHCHDEYAHDLSGWN